jgi:hypothetical protein
MELPRAAHSGLRHTDFVPRELELAVRPRERSLSVEQFREWLRAIITRRAAAEATCPATVGTPYGCTLAIALALSWYRVLSHLTIHRHAPDRVIPGVGKPHGPVTSYYDVSRRGCANPASGKMSGVGDGKLLELSGHSHTSDLPCRTLGKPDGAIRAGSNSVRVRRRRKWVLGDFTARRDASNAWPSLGEPERAIRPCRKVHGSPWGGIRDDLSPWSIPIDGTGCPCVDDPQCPVRSRYHVHEGAAGRGSSRAQRNSSRRYLVDRRVGLSPNQSRAQIPKIAPRAGSHTVLDARTHRARRKAHDAFGVHARKCNG